MVNNYFKFRTLWKNTMFDTQNLYSSWYLSGLVNGLHDNLRSQFLKSHENNVWLSEQIQ